MLTPPHAQSMVANESHGNNAHAAVDDGVGQEMGVLGFEDSENTIPHEQPMTEAASNAKG